ncbi:MAG: PolC-type DNA polymerase III [Clostridiales bacterium]|nr:PolC-type DNA polymerase III [Clostridiales bacterium]
MAKTGFAEKFKKYSPQNKDDINVLEHVADFRLSADVDKRMIQANCTFDVYFPPERIESVENGIKEAYELQFMAIYPHFENTPFSIRYVPHVFYELSKMTSLGNGFFEGAESALEGAEVSADENVLKISLKNGGKKLLLSGNCDGLISDVIYRMFGERYTVEFTGVTTIERGEEEVLPLSMFAREKIKEKASVSGRSSIFEGESKASADTENSVIQSGRMKFDVSDMKTVMGKFGKTDVIPIRDAKIGKEQFTICGEVFSYQKKLTKKEDKCIVSFYITDRDASAVVRLIYDAADDVEMSAVKDGACVMLKGIMQNNKFDDGAIEISPRAIAVIKEIKRTDKAEKKRVELHLHTTMSTMDSVFSPKDVVETVKRFGQTAVAVTDHGNLQAYPEIMTEAEKAGADFKIIYGIEAYFVDDTATAVFGDGNADFENDVFCVFDLETTGLSERANEIIEIGAALYKNGEILDTFESFVNPGIHISETITEITGIKDDDVKDAPYIKDVLPKFLEFAGKAVFVAHNANFDIGFIRKDAEKLNIDFNPTYVDTVAMSRYCNADLKTHKLDSLAKYFSLGDFNHHRAFEDAKMLALIFEKLQNKIRVEGIKDLAGLKRAMSGNCDPKKLKSYHQIILVKNLTGLKNLYKLVSYSYLNYFYRVPRIPKTVLETHRDGLIIGSACESGDLFQAIFSGKQKSEIVEIAKFYDFLEVQPIGNNRFMVEKGLVADENALIDINKTIISLGDELNIPVVATGDVHFNEPEDEIFRHILLAGQKYSDADRDVPLYMKTTDEMLAEFNYLEPEKAYEIVVENTNKIADMIENIRPIPKGSYPPHMDGAEEELKESCYKRARELYGENLPEIVEKRLERELEPIIKHGFAVLYVIARRLIKYSEKNGYLVASRGSVGSSFVATMAGITEVNPLVPHYRCPKCKYSEFITDGSYDSGFDLPPKKCPNCNTDLLGDGHTIPFETFLGFEGDKSPDIDLNFSGEVQGKVHKYTEVLFGEKNVFRAGTIGTIAEKNAYGYVKKYLEERNIVLNKAEEQRLTNGCTGVKRTTGQHPGGIIVVPKEYDIYDFTPVQHPADDAGSGVITTHFAFKYLHDTILKLDLLGHDVPTKYKMMEKYSGISVLDIPMNDPEVMELFISTKSLKINPADIDSEVGTFGIPECGTKFVRQMIVESKPKSFADLLQISGLSHGTDVWLSNAQELIHNGTCTISEVIGTRDSIMTYLMNKGLEPSFAFNIMEITRKGRAREKLTPEMIEKMKAHGVPDWYIDSCMKIKYMFPKAHAVAYDMSALRLGWFKVHMPQVFYSAFLSVAPGGFDAEIVTKGKEHIKAVLREIEQKGKDATQKEQDMVSTLQLCNEACARGFKFLRPDLKKSHSKHFLPEGEFDIRCPFSSMGGLGESAAESIYKAASEGEILSVEDLKTKTQITKAVIEILRKNGVLDDLNETNQLRMF